MSKTQAGPPPYTITCEQPRPFPPGYNQPQASAPPPAGWCGTPPGPAGMPQPGVAHVPVTHHHHQNIHVHQPAFQQPPYHQPQVVGSTSVLYVAQQPQVMISTVRLSSHPAHLTCPTCRNVINTKVTHSPGTKTHLWAACLCVFGCWLGCCLFPYCMSSCKNAEHSCPDCGAYIGTKF